MTFYFIQSSLNFLIFTQEKAKEMLAFNFRVYKDEDLKRKFKFLSKLGYAALPDSKYRKITNAIDAMESNYAKVKICSYNDPKKCDLQLEPDITEVLEKSENPEELKYYWIEWYNKAGTPVRQQFDQYVALNKEAAILNSKNLSL